MADYKRMVSYMYQYEKGVKKKNVGYARIESRSGQCKITLHMQLLGQYDSIFPTYLIQRDDKNTELIYLGDSQLKNQIMDSRLMAEEANIMGSGFRLSQTGGLLIFLNENVFYATEWDDKPIVAAELLNSLKPKPKQTKASNETAGKSKIDYDYGNYEEMKAALLQGIVSGEKDTRRKNNGKKERTNDDLVAENILEEIQQIEEETQEEFESAYEDENNLIKPEFEIGIEDPVETGADNVVQIHKEPEQEEKDYNMKASHLLQPVEELESQDDNGWFLGEADTSIPVYKLPRGWKTIEYVQKKDQESAPAKKETESEQNDISGKDSTMPEESGKVENLQETVSDTSQKVPQEESSEQPDHPLAGKIFENYPRIYPFEDNEITMCVKIEPKDIGFLPMSTWVLNSNSFLLHGYYCYRHLIFARINDKYGSRYILGVPGIYHNREQFMARMFGFEQFKSIRKRELRQGDFGYWYITVSM